MRNKITLVIAIALVGGYLSVANACGGKSTEKASAGEKVRVEVIPSANAAPIDAVPASNVTAKAAKDKTAAGCPVSGKSAAEVKTGDKCGVNKVDKASASAGLDCKDGCDKMNRKAEVVPAPEKKTSKQTS